MKLLGKIPGFRTQNNTKVIIAIIYYALFLGAVLGSSSIKMALLYGSFISIPYIIFEIKNNIKDIKNKEFKFNISSIVNIAIIIVIILGCGMNIDTAVVETSKLKEYKSLTKKIEDLQEEDSKYYTENTDEISKYLDLQVKYEELSASFEEYKLEHPESVLEEVKQAKDDVNKLYAQAIALENEVKEVEKAKLESVVASSSNSSSESSSGSNDNSSSNSHIGKQVYVSNGNSYYHAISNCKYLEGAPTSLVTLTSSMRKYECNCWTNPVAYKPSSSSSGSSSSSSSSGKTVYIASGNSYYHKSPSCKFLNGASASAVDLNNVGGKHACNCIKY